ncbi:MAG: 6-carboxytetrahydropterin synthase QueD [Thiotrichales bacterium]|jgi:6-pyruvoyltetrahydropterin/6-carboxytetrahydropterin synthase|nr:6-carboxytetrahydropterin synthase QueD [Thiotrichales bacterium]MBT3614297.1 6-carboxytetrahydropterin synthase QueD [Thiotrichales bacterium]MBT3752415.1 6-carboxytetrahydropterin synthase QueD [Thiotrichales bacterium]MBT3837217.1 6-carboxytetrahydropterin synthase QueD [Thiotrichales bacterium]MBT4151933.1 6-carboxytetrahydropterin synthase QueD [Thiotrichales bacterium]
MPNQFKLQVVSDFAAAHSLRDYPGDCQKLHGHNWKVEVEVVASELDDLGMAVDFKKIKQITKEATDRLDHSYLNELDPFNRINPTAENIARTLFKDIGKKLDSAKINSTAQIERVTIWETERASASYSES